MLLAVALTHLADPENATSAYEQAGKLYVLQVNLNLNLKLYNQCTTGCLITLRSKVNVYEG